MMTAEFENLDLRKFSDLRTFSDLSMFYNGGGHGEVASPNNKFWMYKTLETYMYQILYQSQSINQNSLN